MQTGDNSLNTDFDRHRMLAYMRDPDSGLEAYVAIHRGSDSVPAFGATRFGFYPSPRDAILDALRLSRLMSHKAALAGLKYGGAKAVVALPKKLKNRQALLKAYAHKVNCLGGSFITGADVGLAQTDIHTMSKISRFFVGIKTDPVKYTALGMAEALKVALKEAFGSESADKRSFAVQGLGKIGQAFISQVYSRAEKIFASDIDPKQVRQAKAAFPRLKIVPAREIFSQKVDVLSPCALGFSLSRKTARQIRSRIILGGANNQLESPDIGSLLFRSGQLYAPDYLVNAGGLISVVNEYETGKENKKALLNKISGIGQRLKEIIAISKSKNQPTNLVADSLAEKIFNSKGF